ncbi:hypothetical protein NRF20_16890 [Streptomyces sp. R-74717]|uniref:hypothetical protein n=1 Tax=Streptomyces TaxID=1883 RepID=UPI0037A7EA00
MLGSRSALRAAHGGVRGVDKVLLSSLAGPHFSSSVWAFFDRAQLSFQIHRHRAHSASGAAAAVDDTRSR